jgi:hypothetical protein
MTLLQPYQDTTGIYTLLSHDSWYVRVLKAAAMTIPFKKLVPYSISFISGWTPDEFDPVRFFSASHEDHTIFVAFRQRCRSTFGFSTFPQNRPSLLADLQS